MKCPYCIKVCIKCGEILVAYNGNFPKNKKCKYGVESECKKCRKEYQKEYRENNKEQIKEHNKEYYENNKEQIKEHKKEYYENNKEQIKGNNKEYYENNKEQIKEHKKEYYENNKEYKKEYNKKYRKNNPEKIFNKNNKRRQLENNQGNGITKEQWYEMMNFFDWRCAYTGVQLNKKNRSIDHIIPLAKGGLNEIWNCVSMEKTYNSSKNVNDMIEWYTQQPFYSEERLNKIYEWIEYAKNKYKN